MSEYDVTVIIAEELAAGNLQRVFAALDPGRRPRVEFISILAGFMPSLKNCIRK